MGSTVRRDFAGTGRLWINGTLVSDAAEVSVKFGGKLNRTLTIGFSGETREDPNLFTADIKGAVLRRESFDNKIVAFIDDDEDVKLKVQVGTNVAKATGKLGELGLDTSQGKSSFSATFSGDRQRTAR